MNEPFDGLIEAVRKVTDVIQIPFILISAVAAFNLSLFPVIKRAIGLREIPTSHKICIIGLPKAGKTTLITALFEIIQKGESTTAAVRLHGGKTINRVNKNIALLNSGRHVAPTVESDIFVFRFSYKSRKMFSLIKEIYDVEVADFPGEYSQKLAADQLNEQFDIKPGKNYVDDGDIEMDDTEYQFVLFKKEFFSWIASSQEYVFVVDLSGIVGSQRPYAAIADMSARVRASWQVIEDAVSDRGIGRANNRPVHIVFTKADCLLAVDLEIMAAHLEGKIISGDLAVLFEAVKDSGDAEDLRVREVIDAQTLEHLTSLVTSKFSDLIAFFKSRNGRVSVIITSMMLGQKTGGRLGVKALLGRILP